MEHALRFYSICERHVSLLNGKLPEEWGNFREKEPESVDFRVEVLFPKIQFGLIEYFEIKDASKCLRYGSDVAFLDFDGKRMRILSFIGKDSLSIFLLQGMYSCFVFNNMIQLHSSLISYQGNGILFLGPSGIGKTTQAELWNKYRDALIINGDIVFVQETPDAFLGWGTPWHGSSPYCENTSVPVAAMVVLKQAPKNSIRELTGFEKVTEVSNSVFYPQWVEGGMELCLETLDHLLTKIPVYELSCRPDEGAVELVEQVVFGHVQ